MKMRLRRTLITYVSQRFAPQRAQVPGKWREGDAIEYLVKDVRTLFLGAERKRRLTTRRQKERKSVLNTPRERGRWASVLASGQWSQKDIPYVSHKIISIRVQWRKTSFRGRKNVVLCANMWFWTKNINSGRKDEVVKGQQAVQWVPGKVVATRSQHRWALASCLRIFIHYHALLLVIIFPKILRILEKELWREWLSPTFSGISNFGKILRAQWSWKNVAFYETPENFRDHLCRNMIVWNNEMN